MKSDRMARVNRLIQGALAEIIPVQIKDPRVQSAGIFSITGVRTTPDLRFATVYVSVNAEQEQAPVIDGLNGAKKFIRSKLAARTHQVHAGADVQKGRGHRIGRAHRDHPRRAGHRGRQ